jgi:hypothetical protein
LLPKYIKLISRGCFHTYVCIVKRLSLRLRVGCRGGVSSTTRSRFESVWLHRVTCRASVEFPSAASGKKFPSYLITARDVTLCVIAHTRLFAWNMTSASPELIYLNPCVFLMCLELPHPSVSLLHLVAFYYAKLTVLIAKTKCRVCYVVAYLTLL